MSKDKSGPAFPQSLEWQHDMEMHTNNPEKYGAPSLCGNGMTLRDYFAAKAMQGWIASGHGGGAEVIATEVYRVADAMLAERAK